MKQIQGGCSNRTTHVMGEASKNTNSHPTICRNLSCRTVLLLDSVFCTRCSCSICGRFEENRDPSLWLICEPDTPQDECCGLTCHIECALKAGTVGAVSTREFMPLDVSFWCTSCGKISRILACLKKQLGIARDAQSVDVLCYRVSLSYRLLDGSKRFVVLHGLVKCAMSKLEAELGPINHGSYNTGHGNISMLSVAHDVHKLCDDAIILIDGWMSNWEPEPSGRDGTTIPSACRFLFVEISSTYVVIDLIDDSQASQMGSISKYHIWCWRCQAEGRQEEPTKSFPATNKRVKISHLHPSTLYAFRIVSFTEAGPLGIAEAKCMMKSADTSPTGMVGSRIQRRKRNSGRIILRSASTREAVELPSEMEAIDLSDHPSQIGYNEGLSMDDMEQACGHTPPSTHMVDLNAVPIPDLNDDLTPSSEPPSDEDNIHTEPTVEDHPTNASRSIRMDDQENCSAEKSSNPKEVNGWSSKSKTPAQPVNESSTYFVEMIRMLEREGHISSDFRLNFITWVNFRSTERDRKVVFSYFEALSDDPQCLGEQLVHSFYDLVLGKPKT